jgi:diguanylate cyclase (GGDEF)-like protein
LIPVALVIVYMTFINWRISARGNLIARRLLTGNLMILPLISLSIADAFWMRTGIDWLAWAPMVLAISFSSLYVDVFWNTGLELADSNRQLAQIRENLELEVARRTSELSSANTRLKDQLLKIHSLQATLKEQAERDPLTGLYNRRTLMETLETDFNLARSTSQPVSLVMIDIDHFKRINDSFGHRAGDHVLQRIAEMLLNGTRQGDYLCRYGGEEFVIVLPGAFLVQAQERAEELRAAIENLQVTPGPHPTHITISLGAAEFPRHGNTPDEVLHQADLALYAAKEAGRNRVSTPEG